MQLIGHTLALGRRAFSMAAPFRIPVQALFITVSIAWLPPKISHAAEACQDYGSFRSDHPPVPPPGAARTYRVDYSFMSWHVTPEGACEQFGQFAEQEDRKLNVTGPWPRYGYHENYYPDGTPFSCFVGKENLSFPGNPCSILVNSQAISFRTVGYFVRFPDPEAPVLPDAGVCSTDTGIEARGNPINPGNGNKFQSEADYRGGSNSSLSFARAYNSRTVGAGNLGGWQHTFSARIRTASTGSSGYQNAPGYSLQHATKEDACEIGWTQIRSGAGYLASAEAKYIEGRCLLYQSQAAVGSINVYADPPETTVREVHFADRADGKTIRFDALRALPEVKLQLTKDLTGFTLVDEQDNIERYDTLGRLRSIRRRSGEVLTLSYGENGQLSAVADSFGRSLGFAYSADGKLASLIDPAGQSTSYTYDMHGRLERVTYPDGFSRKYIYDSPNFPTGLTGIVDENGGRFATWSYDASGRATSSKHAGAVEGMTFTYNADGTTTVVNALGATEELNFIGSAEHRKLISSSIAACSSCGTSAQISFDANGFVSSRTDYNRNVTKYVRDSRGLETSRTDAFGPTLPRN